MIASMDENKNGNPDIYVFDFSKNSIRDTVVVDADEDLNADIILFDNNENGVVKMIEFVTIVVKQLQSMKLITTKITSLMI